MGNGAVTYSLQEVSPCRQIRKLALTHCRGVRRMHLNSNMSACEQAPVSQFGSSAHGSLLRAKVHGLGIEKSGGVNKVNIKIDASRVAGLITGSANLDKVVYDTWYLKDVELMSGKIYGLVSEYGQGCMYLSYLLGGKIDFGDLQIFIDGINVSKEDLKSISWNLEPSKEKYRNKTVRKSIEKSIIKNKCSDTFEDIVEAFYLDERRHDIKLQYLSGDRWRASAALGYVSGKSIFYAPYENTSFYHSMYGSNMFKALRYLADKGTIIVLPVGSDTFIKSVVDECIYLDPVYEQ